MGAFDLRIPIKMKRKADVFEMNIDKFPPKKFDMPSTDVG